MTPIPSNPKRFLVSVPTEIVFAVEADGAAEAIERVKRGEGTFEDQDSPKDWGQAKAIEAPLDGRTHNELPEVRSE